MANTYVLIASNTLGSDTASVTFSSIPSTYTDLVLRTSARTDVANYFDRFIFTFNSDSGSNYSDTYLAGSGSAASSNTASNATSLNSNRAATGSTATASTFSNSETYFPNYAGNTNKPISSFNVGETNNAAAQMAVEAQLWRNTAALTSITIAPGAGTNFVSGSSFYLYGIKNS